MALLAEIMELDPRDLGTALLAEIMELDSRDLGTALIAEIMELDPRNLGTESTAPGKRIHGAARGISYGLVLAI